MMIPRMLLQAKEAKHVAASKSSNEEGEEKEAEKGKKGPQKKKPGSAKKAQGKTKKPPVLLNSPFGKQNRNKKTALYFLNETLTKEFKDAFKQRGVKHFKTQLRNNLKEPIRYEFEEQADLDLFNEIWGKSTAATGNVVIGLKEKEVENSNA